MITNLINKIRLFILYIFSIIMFNAIKKMKRFINLYKDILIKIKKLFIKFLYK